jgi:hypothetical protein
LPPKEAEAEPWDKMCIDLIGPYKIKRKGTSDLKKINKSFIRSRGTN